MADADQNGRQTGTRVGAVMDALRERIASRALLPGARVPSLRTMSETLSVSKSHGGGGV